MLNVEDLTPADEAVLSVLYEGRGTAPFVAEETEYSLQYVRDRLNRLVEHGNAREVYEGLYELVDDPRIEEVDDDISKDEIVEKLQYDLMEKEEEIQELENRLQATLENDQEAILGQERPEVAKSNDMS